MHTHSTLSPDGQDTQNNNFYGKMRLAKQMGISYMAITDHYDGDDIRGYNHDIEAAKAAAGAAKRDLKDKNFTPIWGIELANVNEFRKEALEIVKKYDFDFVLGSLHMTTGSVDPYFIEYGDKEKYPAQVLMEMLDTYVDELYTIASEFDFDSLAHIGYPVRYMKRRGRGAELDLCAFDGKIKDIFKALIERDKCLEINTSELRKGGNTTYPSQRLIKMYYDMGGRNVTIGSDSHDEQSIGSFVKETKQVLRDMGFTYTCAFENRKKIQIPII